MRRRSPEFRKNVMLVAFLLGGLLLVRAGALPLWIWIVLTVITAATRLLPVLDPYRDELLVTADGIRREHGSKLRRKAVEALRWDELVRVDVLTHETGPAGKDMLFLLYGNGDTGVAVSGTLASRHGLVPLLEQRLAGFRSDHLARANATPERATFTLWERDTPALAGQAPNSGAA